MCFTKALFYKGTNSLIRTLEQCLAITLVAKEPDISLQVKMVLMLIRSLYHQPTNSQNEVVYELNECGGNKGFNETVGMLCEYFI